MDLSLVSIHGFGTVIPVPVNCRSHLFYATEWNVVCAGMICVMVPPILCEFVLIFVRGLFFVLWQRLCFVIVFNYYVSRLFEFVIFLLVCQQVEVLWMEQKIWKDLIWILYATWKKWNDIINFFFSWLYNPHWGLYFTALQWALASSLTRFLDHIQRRATSGRTPLDVAETSTWQHTTFTTDKYPYPGWDSNPQSQQASGQRPTP